MESVQAPADDKMATKSKDFIEKFGMFLDAYPGAGFREVVRLIPDGLFLGTGLFALLSQNYPTAILFLTMFETLLITVGLQNLFGYLSLPDVLPTGSSVGKACVSGFHSISLQTLSLFFKMPMKSSFPSPPVFLLTTACAYILASIQQFGSELEELGPGFSMRFYLGLVFSLLLIAIVSIYRLISNCDTWGVLMLTIIIGAGLGFGLSYQNKILLGKEAINLLGIPVFSNATANGKPLYICPQTSS